MRYNRPRLLKNRVMNETSQTPTCSRCGATLAPDALKGLCPRCLMALNLAAPTKIPGETGPRGTRVAKPLPSPDEIAKHFPQFEILEFLGRGGMGVVYKVRQPKLNRIVALKILAPENVAEPKFAERFEREAQALARLNHPNIVTVYDFGETDGLYFLTMEFVDGVSLRQLLLTRKIAPEEALAIVPKICEALQFAHEQGVVHRDIKPENMLLDKQGRVKIADFGIAKIVEGTAQEIPSPSLTATHSPSDGEGAGESGEGLTQDQVLGTPHYMAPEQVEHPQRVDHRADIYSLGVVFYEMLTSELPLGKFQPPSKKVQVDVRLDEVVLRTLEKEPERRYQQASQVKTDVETISSSPRVGSSAGEKSRFASPATRYNSTEPTIVGIGTLFFVFLLSAGLEMSRASMVPFKETLILMCIVGLGICALSLAGIWPFPSPWFPEPNFSSRNLRRRNAAAASEVELGPHFSRTAIWGAGCLALAAFAVSGVILAAGGANSLALQAPNLPSTEAWLRWQFLFRVILVGQVGGAILVLTGTILGWIAISQIRHSQGRLYGIGLAVFDGLLLPLLAVDTLIASFFWIILPYLIQGNGEPNPVITPAGLTALFTAVVVVVDYLIVRGVWRAVNRPLANANSLPDRQL